MNSCLGKETGFGKSKKKKTLNAQYNWLIDFNITSAHEGFFMLNN